MDEKIKSLTDAVEKLHGAKAHFVGSVAVDERFQDKTVWRGIVSQFELQDHPKAKICYAWSVSSNSKQKFYAVLQTPEVSSPELAVRASIVAEHRKSAKG